MQIATHVLLNSSTITIRFRDLHRKLVMPFEHMSPSTTLWSSPSTMKRIRRLSRAHAAMMHFGLPATRFLDIYGNTTRSTLGDAAESMPSTILPSCKIRPGFMYPLRIKFWELVITPYSEKVGQRPYITIALVLVLSLYLRRCQCKPKPHAHKSKEPNILIKGSSL